MSDQATKPVPRASVLVRVGYPPWSDDAATSSSVPALPPDAGPARWHEPSGRRVDPPDAPIRGRRRVSPAPVSPAPPALPRSGRVVLEEAAVHVLAGLAAHDRVVHARGAVDQVE